MLKKKYELDGSRRHKSRVVTLGYIQIPGVDDENLPVGYVLGRPLPLFPLIRSLAAGAV